MNAFICAFEVDLELSRFVAVSQNTTTLGLGPVSSSSSASTHKMSHERAMKGYCYVPLLLPPLNPYHSPSSSPSHSSESDGSFTSSTFCFFRSLLGPASGVSLRFVGRAVESKEDINCLPCASRRAKRSSFSAMGVSEAR